MNNRCEYCVQYYKKGVFNNVKSFLERLESEDNDLKEIMEDNNNDNNNVDDNDDDNENNDNNEINESSFLLEQDSINLKYSNALSQMHNW
ncbi:hypothetical protein F8M41_016582 [Gigaspora margarita]|uniref:Uncharacterized protein n=1 Tax=Gigaspora margarita TaxID=4874 RepID=A0A8H3WVK9_GIGMA|nr:hypothetical protein F8M41_016582 [Gigaspora margarita]